VKLFNGTMLQSFFHAKTRKNQYAKKLCALYFFLRCVKEAVGYNEKIILQLNAVADFSKYNGHLP